MLRTVLASEYKNPGDRRHRLSERVRKIDVDSCLKDSIVDDSLDYFERRREEGLPKPIREQDLLMGRRSWSTKRVQREPQCDLVFGRPTGCCLAHRGWRLGTHASARTSRIS